MARGSGEAAKQLAKRSFRFFDFVPLNESENCLESAPLLVAAYRSGGAWITLLEHLLVLIPAPQHVGAWFLVCGGSARLVFDAMRQKEFKL